jgi:hypothetical protein
MSAVDWLIAIIVRGAIALAEGRRPSRGQVDDRAEFIEQQRPGAFACPAPVWSSASASNVIAAASSPDSVHS